MYRFDGILKKDENGNFVLDSNGMLDIDANGQGYAKLTTEQETWFYNLLNETLTGSNASAEGYSVIVLNHYALDDCDGANVLNGRINGSENGGVVLNYQTQSPVNFHNSIGNSDGTSSALILNSVANMRNRVADNSTQGYAKGEVNNFGDILQKWQDNGGKFIAWICGHSHTDYFYYPKKYPNLLCVVLEKAGVERDTSVAKRSNNSISALSANFYAIDTTTGMFKIVRLGLNTNKNLRAKNTLCYNYINKWVISET